MEILNSLDFHAEHTITIKRKDTLASLFGKNRSIRHISQPDCLHHY